MKKEDTPRRAPKRRIFDDKADQQRFRARLKQAADERQLRQQERQPRPPLFPKDPPPAK